MNIKLVRHIAGDVILWAGIYFGLYKGVEIASNAVLFVGWFSAVMSLLVGLTLGKCSLSDDAINKMKKTKLHQSYAASSTFAEAVAFAAFGYYVLAGFYVAGFIIYASASQKVIDNHGKQ